MPRPELDRRQVGDNSRRLNDFATLREVGAIVNEGQKRQREYIDSLFDSLVQEIEDRRLSNKVKKPFKEIYAKASRAFHKGWAKSAVWPRRKKDAY